MDARYVRRCLSRSRLVDEPDTPRNVCEKGRHGFPREIDTPRPVQPERRLTFAFLRITAVKGCDPEPGSVVQNATQLSRQQVQVLHGLAAAGRFPRPAAPHCARCKRFRSFCSCTIRSSAPARTARSAVVFKRIGNHHNRCARGRIAYPKKSLQTRRVGQREIQENDIETLTGQSAQSLRGY